MISLVVGSYIWHASFVFAGNWTFIPWTADYLNYGTLFIPKTRHVLGSKQPSWLQNKLQGAVMRIRLKQSFEAHIETILNSNMPVAYITDCATSPVILRHQSCRDCATSPVEIAPPVLHLVWEGGEGGGGQREGRKYQPWVTVSPVYKIC